LGEVAAEAALLVDPHNARELADRIIEVLESESLRASLKAKGFVRAKQFTWAQSALQTHDLYASLVR
jgi:glycosyltransferase involved in cell wall biosynthesis